MVPEARAEAPHSVVSQHKGWGSSICFSREQLGKQSSWDLNQGSQGILCIGHLRHYTKLSFISEFCLHTSFLNNPIKHCNDHLHVIKLFHFRIHGLSQKGLLPCLLQMIRLQQGCSEPAVGEKRTGIPQFSTVYLYVGVRSINNGVNTGIWKMELKEKVRSGAKL